MALLGPDALAQQLAAAHRRFLAHGGAPDRGLGAWSTLLALALAAPPDQRAALAPLVERAGRVAPDRDALVAGCLVGVGGLIDPAAAQPRLRAALAQATDWADRGTLVAALSEPERRAGLAALFDQALALPDDPARWAACDDLTRALDDAEADAWTRWFAAASHARFGRASDDPYRWLGEPPTAAQRAQRIAEERARWGASFEAWRLGDDAVALPEAQRGPALDRAIDAFAALVTTPIDPGNDEGPFWAIARHLSLAQTRRALAILARMDPPAWCYQLAGSRAALATRLAVLGHADEARAVVQAIGVDGTFDVHWRATAWGGLIAGRLAHEPGLTVAAALAAVAADDPATLASVEGRAQLLSALHHGAAPLRALAHAPALADTCIAEVQALGARDPRRGRIALEECIGAWGPVVPCTRWLALVAAQPDGAARVDLLEALVGEDPAAIAALIDELARTPSPYPPATLRLLLDHRPAVSPAALAPAWDAWLAQADAAHGGFARAVDELRDLLPAAVVYLAGPDAPAHACRAIAAVTAS